jgi:hypothetical protein
MSSPSHRSRARKRARKKRAYALRPKVTPIAAKISWRGLIANLPDLQTSRALSEVFDELQQTT